MCRVLNSLGDENAMKTVNNELKSMNAILSTHIKYVHVPFMLSITTRGYRVLCQSNLPIGKKPPAIV